MREDKALRLAVTLLLVLGASTGHAGEWYAGARLGPMMLDAADTRAPLNAGVCAGHEWQLSAGSLAAEAEYTDSIDKGETAGVDLAIQTMGLFGVVRSQGQAYIKARLGVTRNAMVVGGVSDADTVTAAGAGFGFVVGPLRIELEYTMVEDTLDFVTVGLQYQMPTSSQ